MELNLEASRMETMKMLKAKAKNWFVFSFFLGVVIFWAMPQGSFGQDAKQQDSQAESLLNQADEAYAKGDYQRAIFAYLQAAQLTENKMHLSRGYMGLSLCYFYLNETENAKKSILKLLEIEPQKEVSPLFHPETFVELFNEVKREMGGRPAGEQPPVVPVEEQPKGKAGEQPPIPGVIAPEVEDKGGYFEVSVHFSGWSIDPAKTFFEDDLEKRFSREVRDEVRAQLEGSHSGLVTSTYEDDLALDSEGSNYGFEIRFYPLGRRGSMSLGFSLEQTRIKIPIRGKVIQRFTDGSEATVDTEGSVVTNPFTTNLSFRWDFAPSWRVTPYLTFGVGIGPLAGEATYTYTGTYQNSSQETIQGGETKTFDDLREEGDIELNLFLLVQFSLGVKGEIYKGITMIGEVGFWDGLLLRAGLAFRF